MAHVLVIDDDDALRETFEIFLEGFGHVVSSAPNGREGLRLLQKQKADVVITDIFMPEADGLEVILEVRKICRKLSVKIPVIAVSSGLRTLNAQAVCFLSQAKIFGADRVFPKPLDFAGIEQAIEELLPAI